MKRAWWAWGAGHAHQGTVGERPFLGNEVLGEARLGTGRIHSLLKRWIPWCHIEPFARNTFVMSNGKEKKRKKEEREPRLPGDKGEEATGHTKQLGTFGTPRCEHRQPQQLNQKEIIFWLNNFILEQKLKIKTTVALSEDPLQTNPPPTPPKKNKKNQ